MSGSAWQIPMMGVNPLDLQQKAASINQTNAQTFQSQANVGLIGQQIQAAKIQNYLAGLQANAIGPLYGGIGNNPAGGAAPPGMAAPNPSAPGGAPPGGAVPGAEAQPGQGSALKPAGPYAVMSPLGVAVPPLLAISALKSSDPKAWESAIQTRARTLAQMMAPVDPNNIQQWNNVAHTAYAAGWLSPDDFATIYNHPEHKQLLMNSFANPDQHLEALKGLGLAGLQTDPATGNVTGSPGAQAGIAGATAARSGAEAGVKLQYAAPTAAAETAGTASESRTPVTIDVKNPDGSVTPTQYLPRDVPAVLARNPGSSVAPAGSAGMLGNFKSAVFGQESGNGANAGTSSAGARGNMQIMPGTFAQYAKPGEKFGDSVDRDTVSQRAIDSLWQQTGGDPMRTAVGYFSGPNNIAPPGSPNPWKQDSVDTDGTKTSDYVKQTMLRMLNAPTPAAQPVAGQGVTKLSPMQAAQLPKFVDYQGVLADKAQGAVTQNALLEQMVPETATWTMGPFAAVKQDALKYLDSIRNNMNAALGPDKNGNPILGAPSQAIGDWQAFNKTAGEFVRQAVRMTSSRAAVQEFPLIERTLPTDTTSPQGFRRITAQLLGMNDWIQAKSQAASNAQGGVPGQFDANWNNSVPIGPYILHRMSTPDAQAMHGALNATPAGRNYWTQTVNSMKLLAQKGMLPAGAMTLDAMTMPGAAPATP